MVINKKNLKLTIITVVYNDLERFIPTYYNVYQSILGSSYKDQLEYIVKDGDSNDGLEMFIRKKKPLLKNFKYISSEDDGIYSAMNQAVRASSGDYVIFINAGDKLLSNGLDICFRFLFQADILAFDFMVGNKVRKQDDFEGMFVHRSPCHQSIVSKKVITKFSEKYKLASDYRFLLKNRNKIKWIGEPISSFGDDFKPISYQKKINKEKINILMKSKLAFHKKLLSIIALIL